jgi:hypothetical protein
MDRVFVIKGSLRCFTFGALSLLPVLGLVPAVLGIILYKRVQLEAGKEWNPARAYLLWGCFLCGLGVSLSTSVLAVASVVVAKELLS